MVRVLCLCPVVGRAELFRPERVFVWDVRLFGLLLVEAMILELSAWFDGLLKVSVMFVLI